MEQGTRTLIFKIIGTAVVLFLGVAVSVLMAMIVKETMETGQLYIFAGMAAASIAALIYIWWPRKKKE